jgi:hypothetical protein
VQLASDRTILIIFIGMSSSMYGASLCPNNSSIRCRVAAFLFAVLRYIILLIVIGKSLRPANERYQVLTEYD